MVFLTLPPNLTEEEEMLLQKYAKLKKKKKALAALKAPKVEKQESVSESLKRPAEAAADATEQAKKLLKSGAIKVEQDRRETQTFKRMKRQKDSEKPVVGFHPFPQSTVSEPASDDFRPAETPSTSRPKQKFNLYENFVSASESKSDSVERDRRQAAPPPPPPRRGNTVYVFGHGVSEDILRNAFRSIGGIVNISVEAERNSCAFVTFEKPELADQAIEEVHGTMVSNVQLKVSMARRQPTLEPDKSAAAGSAPSAEAGSTNTWSSIAASSSQKGSHHDNRDLVTYEDDMF